MVETGQVQTIRQLSYRHPGDAVLAVETLTFARLRELDRGTTQRADFHVLAFVEAGSAAVMLDFREQPLEAGDAVWIGPGVVHRWSGLGGVEGRLVLFRPEAPVTSATRALAAMPGVTAHWRPPTDARFDAALAHLVLESAPDEDPGTTPEVLGCLLSVVLERMGAPEPGALTSDGLFAAFRHAVERDLDHRHGVDHYARLLGYAPRTLARAALAATGRTAKAYLDDRLTLEAKRLLAHEGLTASQCASRLGFSDPSAFSTFFLRTAGVRPGEWVGGQR